MYYYNPTNDTSCRGTLMINVVSARMSPATTTLQKLFLIQTVEGQKELCDRNGIKATISDRDLHQTIMSPGKRKMERIARNVLIQDSTVTTEHLTHTNHIYGTDVLGLKGKGTKRKIPYISIDIINVPPSINSIYRNVTACGDIFFINKVTLFGAISLNI